MKSKQILTIVISVIVGFSIGLMSGLTLTSPGMSLMEAAGTIGRVDQYRNVRITQDDIELRNELAENAERRETFLNYLSYEYARNIQMGENVRFAIRSGESAGDFRTANPKTMEQLNQYDEFLDNARLRILEAIGTLQNLGERDKVAVHTVLTDAGNALAQNSLRDGVLFDFMRGVERFFKTASPSAFPELANAHDQVFTSLVSDNLIKGNRPTLENLLAKRPMGDENQLGFFDTEKFQLQLAADAEQLGTIWDAEQLGSIFFDAEQLGFLANLELLQLLGNAVIMLDTELLGLFANAEQLGLADAEQLGLANAEQLELLGRIIFFDAEQLGFLANAELLQLLGSAEQLGTNFFPIK